MQGSVQYIEKTLINILEVVKKPDSAGIVREQLDS